MANTFLKAETLATWIQSAKVDLYEKENKQVFIASKHNEHLIFTSHRVQYPHGLHPHVNIVWIKDGESVLVSQDILDETYEQIKHSTGNLIGDHSHGENIETIWRSLYCKVNNKPFTIL